MQKKIAAAFCLTFSCLPCKSIFAKTSNLSFVINFGTTILTDNKYILQDYMFFRDFNGGELLKKQYADLMKFSKFPASVGVNLGYGLNFTNKLGILFNLGLGKGNLAIVSFDTDKDEIKNSVYKDWALKIEALNACLDFRFKYDLLNSSLDFDDYGRTGWLLYASLGFKLNWLFSKDFLPAHIELWQAKDNQTGKCSKRLNSWFCGGVLGVDLVFPINLGIGIDGIMYFNNLFCSDSTLENEDAEWLRKTGMNQAMPNGGPSYNTRSWFFQIAFKIFYDFAPFCNNHEAPSEIDIEKW